MVELTHGGTWINWDTLSKRDRNWALLSFTTAMLAALPLGVGLGDWGYRLGFSAGSGGREPPQGHSPILSADVFAYAMLTAAVLAVISALAWWRFSRNQDEMFNKIQNYAIGMAGGWTLALASLWWLLSLGGWIEPLSLTAVVVFGYALVLLFWFRAVRRWL